MKWGLFGGTFDPVHTGHLRAAEELAETLELDSVIFIPAAVPPHKTDRDITPFEHRLAMTRLAAAGNDRFSVSDIEAHREGKSYSIDTVRHFLAAGDRRPELFFITGQDAFNAITTWRDWKMLLDLCHFAVMTRPGYSNGGLQEILPADVAATYKRGERYEGFINPQGKGVFFRKTTFVDISASDIRKRVASGRSIRYLTPDPVIRYIEAKQLYR